MTVNRQDTQTDNDVRTPLGATLTTVLFASVGTGVVWNGIPFIAKHDYGFGKRENLLLYIMIGVIYILAALAAGTITRRLERWLSPRAILVLVHIVLAVSCVGPILLRGAWMLWLTAGVNSLLSAFLWPMVESYVTAGRHGGEMRRAIGWFNIVWTGAVAAGMILMAPVVEDQARVAIVGLGALYIVGLVPIHWFPRAPGAHDEEMSAASVGEDYSRMLQSSRVLLPLSYVLNSALAPLLPFLFQRLELRVLWETPATATWMVTRVVVMLIMWRAGFWHGRWGTLLLGGVLMTGGFALVVLAQSLPLMLLGFACLGAGLGIVYYAALYYAMAVGRAQIDAGGRHEALIGAGYTVGPMAVLIGLQVANRAESTVATATRAEHVNAEGIAVVIAVWILIAIGSVAAVLPYVRARRLRAATTCKT